ncbi:hypothetical protein RHJ81_19210 [Clostridioides difficile]|nr:hypothetical protein [Clostridioides difficile]
MYILMEMIKFYLQVMLKKATEKEILSKLDKVDLLDSSSSWFYVVVHIKSFWFKVSPE